MDEEFFTVAEVAERLKMNEQTIRNWIDRGELPAIRLGARRVRVRQADLDRFIEAGAPAPDTDKDQIVVQSRRALAKALGKPRSSTDDAALVAALQELSRASAALAEALTPDAAAS
jgi:excisionase family DNA binding protein